MRVIAGTAKRLQLKTLDGMETRPTTDRIKEKEYKTNKHVFIEKAGKEMIC